MDLLCFIHGDRELTSYEKHGIACMRLGKMNSPPKSACRIDLAELRTIECPRAFWIMQTPKAPTIIFASEKAKSIPVSAKQFEEGRIPDRVTIRYAQTHPRVAYDNVETEVSYL